MIMKKTLAIMLSIIAGLGILIITQAFEMSGSDSFICGLIVFCTGVILTFSSH